MHENENNLMRTIWNERFTFTFNENETICGGLVAQWLWRWIRDREVVSSTPGQSAKSNNSEQVVHTYVPV